MADMQPCPDVSRLQRLLDGLLTEQDQADVSAHLADCSACQERLDALIAGKEFWSDVARNLKSADAEIEAGTPTCYAARPGEGLEHTDEDLTLEFLQPSEKPESLGRLSHYEVLEVIGRGGMGIVLRAFDEKLHRVVAIKVMAPRLAATSPPRKRFLREARAAAQVRHENVVDIHAVEEQPIPHLVMEYVPGESLQQRLDRIGPLEVPDVLRIGQQIARGLAAAHAQGLIHRDVKPGNVLLEKGIEERVKITDFGLARAADDASVTQSGVIAGTPLFMAPEQAQGGVIDHRADLFSLGSVLYTMASGRPPFRAPTSLAVLKRVVEDAPRPIQEIIPEVPQWLCDIICKLHAKRPEDRFQSAKEVAVLLGQCLAQGQPSADAIVRSPGTRDGRSADCKLEVSKPVAKSQIPNPQSQIGHRHWALAAVAAVVFLFVWLSRTEATGVTQVAATVVRLLTPDGTLIVETNDPGVKVTVEGDGGLVITGAGLEEIRLRPGSYRVHADRGGKPIPLDKDLVTVDRGGRAVVKVKLEFSTPPAGAKAEKGAFVVLTGKGDEVHKFDSLAEAVLGANAGDTIEVRGNGPFVTPPIKISRPLTIRAGQGFRPVIQLISEVSQTRCALFAEAPLVLEGLELQRTVQDRNYESHALLGVHADLHAANCRFLARKVECCIASKSPVCELRNCEILCSEGVAALLWHSVQSGQELKLDNCLAASADRSCWLSYTSLDVTEDRIRLTRNTFRASVSSIDLAVQIDKAADLKNAVGRVKGLRVQAAANIFAVGSVLIYGRDPSKILPPGDTNQLLARVLDWTGDRNLYAVDGSRASEFGNDKPAGEPMAAMKSLADWKQYWKSPETGSLEARVRYQGGDLLARLEAAPDKITPDDFRLRPDSPGYRAGEGGKDLGADVDLVGPGEAYERWKQTPEYQQWLKETGQQE